jgi:hypothetical protein
LSFPAWYVDVAAIGLSGDDDDDLLVEEEAIAADADEGEDDDAGEDVLISRVKNERHHETA